MVEMTDSESEDENSKTSKTSSDLTGGDHGSKSQDFFINTKCWWFSEHSY